MCGPGWRGDLPWLNIAAMLSSEFSLAGEFIFCKGCEANGLQTGVEMPERCEPLSAVPGLTQGQRAPCPEWDGNRDGEECVEGLELSPLAPRGRSGHFKSGLMSPCRQKIPSCSNSSLLGHRAGINSQLPSPDLKGAGREAAESPASGREQQLVLQEVGFGRAPLPWGLQHQPWAPPAASITTRRAPLITHPEEKREKRQEDRSPDLQKKKPRQMGRVFSTCTVKTTLHQQSEALAA